MNIRPMRSTMAATAFLLKPKLPTSVGFWCSLVIDSRSCRSAPSGFTRGFDGGKKVRGIKIQVAVEKYGIPLAVGVSPATCMGRGNAVRRYTKGIVPVLRELAGQGFRDSALGDLGYRGKRLAKRRSASPSKPSPAAVTASSSRPESAGSWSAPSPGLLATGG